MLLKFAKHVSFSEHFCTSKIDQNKVNQINKRISPVFDREITDFFKNKTFSCAKRASEYLFKVSPAIDSKAQASKK